MKANPGLEDACQAFAEACQAKDWSGAADAYHDMHTLCSDEYSETEDEGKEGGKKSPAIALIFGSKKK